MSDGLVGSLVDKSFSPSCANCYHQLECAAGAKHPAFPQTWPWAKSSVPFREGLLIVRSWVGNDALYVPHDNCGFYRVSLRFTRLLKLHHKRYLSMEWQKQRINAELSALEEQEIENGEAEMLEEDFRRLLNMQSLISRTYAPIGSEEESDDA
jgi:hypothetical protein